MGEPKPLSEERKNAWKAFLEEDLADLERRQQDVATRGGDEEVRAALAEMAEDTRASLRDL